MKQFFKFFFASVFGVIVAMFLFVFILAGIGGAIVASLDTEDKVKIEDGSILRIKMDAPIVDRAEDNPFDKFEFGPFQSEKENGLNQYLAAIKSAKTDDNIKGILLDIQSAPGGTATLQEIREALDDFKSSGKFLKAYSENLTQSGYYIASVADKVYLYPEGEVAWKGLASEVSFIKGTLEKLDIDMQVFKGTGNDYKSAAEGVTRKDLSEANRAQLQEILDDLWGVMVGEISQSRSISAEDLNTWADNMSILTADDAKENNLVDDLKYWDEVRAELMADVGDEDAIEDDEIEFVGLSKYYKATKQSSKDADVEDWENDDENQIAVIYATGGIFSGSGDKSTIGSTTTAAHIREARKDSNIKAIVFRVNSGGGSALASDVIWREAKLAQATKPFVVSMGDVAASGGYYISAAADKIYAQSNTITGSIGVIGLIPNMEGFFNDKLGFTFDIVKTNENAEGIGVNRPIDAYKTKKIQMSIDNVYDNFKTIVADGRELERSHVDSIARGRVYSGQKALELGLVDEIGGIDAAIADAAARAELEEGTYDMQVWPKYKDPIQEIMQEFGGKKEEEAMVNLLGSNYAYFKAVKNAVEMQGIQARMPFDIIIK